MRNRHLEDTVEDKSFCLKEELGVTALDRTHQYHYQVQQQLHIVKNRLAAVMLILSYGHQINLLLKGSCQTIQFVIHVWKKLNIFGKPAFFQSLWENFTQI